jgi:hypothetical protein
MELPLDADVAKPCRPTISCTADIVAPGSLEVEMGAQYSKLGGDDRVWTFPVLLKQSLATWLQLQVGSNGYTILRSSPGVPIGRHVDNLIAGPKLHLLDQGDVAPSLAITAQASLPVFADGHDAIFLTAHASKDVGPLHADLNAGAYTWWGEGNAEAQPFGALALSVSPVTPFGFALEGYAFADALPYASRDGGLRAVVTTTPKPWLVFDVGGDVGFFPSARAATAFLGMTIVPVVFWRAGR